MQCHVGLELPSAVPPKDTGPRFMVWLGIKGLPSMEEGAAVKALPGGTCDEFFSFGAVERFAVESESMV